MGNTRIHLASAALGSVLVLTCIQAQALRTPKQHDVTLPKSRPAICVYVDGTGLSSREGKPPSLVVAVWPDGLMLWSKNTVDGGAPYLSGRTTPKLIAKLFDNLRKTGTFKDKSMTRPYFGPDSSYTIVDLQSGKDSLRMQSWHEIYEKKPTLFAGERGLRSLGKRTREQALATETESYQHYRKVWDTIRETVQSWQPADPQEFKGDVTVSRDDGRVSAK